jgi:hypothetical protein
LAQLGNRVQHALRAFTPRDQKAVRAAAETLRQNPAFDTETAITELSIGEALISLLDGKGSPGIAERAWVLTPSSRIGPIADAERDAIRKQSASSYGHYEQAVDRESAYEKLTARIAAKDPAAAAPTPPGAPIPPVGSGSSGPSIADNLSAILFGTTGPRGGRHPGLIDSAARSAARAVGSGVGRAILRGALGSILGGTSTRSRR